MKEREQEKKKKKTNISQLFASWFSLEIKV